MAEQSFLRGAFILMIANFINRVLGFVLRITLVRFVGDEALGLFQMAYPIFTSLLIICTAGLPVAIAKLIPEEMAGEENKDPYKYIKITLIFVGILSVIITVGFMSSADL